MNTALLIIFFNRSDPIRRLISEISIVKPKKIYLACDGPRKSVSGEAEKVKDIRSEVLGSISWPCEIRTKFEDENLGCKINVSEAVFWFFSNEAKGIVFEDDCIPSLKFFNFAEKMLEKYKDNKNIGAITGRNEVSDVYEPATSYIFTTKFFCWGWASWSDRILNNNVDIGYKENVPSSIFRGVPFNEKLMIKGMLGLMRSGSVNSWAYPFDLSFRNKGQLCLVPKKNLIKNIGFDVEGAHSKGQKSDSLVIENQFYLDDKETVLVENDRNFMDAFLKKRYPSLLHLYAYSLSRYLYPIKKFMFR